ncbi:MAG: hypothetical protein K6C36_07330 [Clostridia bacterium]|nr:hypothetical protein [Clostridia bacterium]
MNNEPKRAKNNRFRRAVCVLLSLALCLGAASLVFAADHSDPLDETCQRLYRQILSVSPEDSFGETQLSFGQTPEITIRLDSLSSEGVRSNPDYQNKVSEIKDAVNRAFFAACYDRPERFWLRSYDLNLSGVSVVSAGGDLYTVRFPKILVTFSGYDLSLTPEQTAERFERVDAETTAFAESLTGLDVYTALRSCRRYVKEHIEYKKDGSDASHEAYAAYYTGTGVCESYSKLFKILCDKLGVECWLVHGHYSPIPDENHMWNCVLMPDGCYYAVDCTFDTPDDPDGYFLVGSETVCEGRSFSSTHIPDPSSIALGEPPEDFSFPQITRSAYDPSSSPTVIVTETTTEPEPTEPPVTVPATTEPVPTEPATVPTEPVTVPTEPATVPTETAAEPTEPATVPAETAAEPTGPADPTSSAKEEPPEGYVRVGSGLYLLCDADFDDTVTAADARIILRIALTLDTPAVFEVCDPDSDGEITAGDARIALRTALGLSA